MKIAKKVAEVLTSACLLIAMTGNTACAITGDGDSPATQERAAAQAQAATAPEALERLTEQEREQAQMLRVDVLSDIVNSEPRNASMPLTARPQAYSTYHKDFEYNADVVLDGVFGSDALYFEVENYWDCRYGYAEIQIDVSQLITDVPASLTFMVNGTPVVSYLIDYDNGRSQTFYVEFPTRLLNAGYNSFEITGYARIFDEEGCLDDFTGANWVSVRKESYIRVGYELRDHERKISYFPYPFISSIDDSGSGSYVAVSDAATGRELEAALSLRAALAAKTGRQDRIHLITAGDISSDADGVILVSQYDNLPEGYRALIDGHATIEQLKARAAVLFAVEDGVPTLLVTSKDEACLMEAAAMLMDEERVLQETGSFATVSKGGIELMQSARAQDMTATGRYTLGDLMGRGLEFIGPFHQEADIFLPYSGGFVLSEASKVSLQFRYSDNLDFGRSMITVYWGNVPVASKKLTRENAGGDELSFTMPYDVIGTHADSLRIAFELELPELFCTPRMDDMPWAYLSDQSVFYLPVGVNTRVQFELRPYPFEQSSVYSDLVVVLPDEKMGRGELEALGHLLTVYGASLEPYGNIEVVTDGELTKEQKEKNLIVLGTYQGSAAVRELNEYLGFSFDEGGEAYRSNAALILSDSYAGRIATMQLFPSPYGEERAVLVCSAATREGLDILSHYLEDDENVWSLSGDTVLIDRDLKIKTYSLQDEATKSKTPILRRLMEENRDSTLFSIVALSVMLLLLLCVVLVAARVYWSQFGRK